MSSIAQNSIHPFNQRASSARPFFDWVMASLAYLAAYEGHIAYSLPVAAKRQTWP
jgi:hypothetical protein